MDPPAAGGRDLTYGGLPFLVCFAVALSTLNLSCKLGPVSRIPDGEASVLVVVRYRPINLSITHISCHEESNFDVREPR